MAPRWGRNLDGANVARRDGSARRVLAACEWSDCIFRAVAERVTASGVFVQTAARRRSAARRHVSASCAASCTARASFTPGTPALGQRRPLIRETLPWTGSYLQPLPSFWQSRGAPRVHKILVRGSPRGHSPPHRHEVHRRRVPARWPRRLSGRLAH
jgi:hypothetical protein